MFVHIEAKLGLKILLDAKVDKNTKLFSGTGFEFRAIAFWDRRGCSVTGNPPNIENLRVDSPEVCTQSRER